MFGLFGALLVLNRHLGRSTAGMYAIIVLNAAIGFVYPGIAWQAHLGGVVTGRPRRGLHRLGPRAGPAAAVRPSPACWLLLVVVAVCVVKYAGVPAICK